MANENGWGDGASNNNIGWGKGAVNNNINWGASHFTSLAGLTDITGQGGGPSVDPDAEAYFTAIEDAGGTLTDNVKAEFNAFVVREKDASRWSKIKRLYPYLGGKIDSAVIDAITLVSVTNNNFTDGDVDSLVGLQGDGTTKRLKAGYSFSDLVSDTANKIQYGSFSDGYNSVGVRNGFALGVVDTIASYYYYPFISTTGIFYGYTGNSNTSSLITGITNTTGLFRHSALRFSTTSAYGILDGIESSQATNDNSTAPLPTREVCLFGRNVNGTFRDFYGEKVLMMYISEFDALQETKDFESSYKTFIDNITA